MKHIFKLNLVALAAIIAFGAFSFTKKTTVMTNNSKLYDFKLKTIEGKEISLEKFKGKKILIVNVASKCGYTPQYKNLEALHQKFGNKVAVIGFPANNFGGQEPGSSKDIQEFCTKNYGVSFQMMEKISVKGNDKHPLYQYLGNKEANGVCDETPNWNFCKYLIDENGKIIKFFSSKTDPMSEEITSLL